MNVDLHYGKGFVTLRIPDENISEIIRPWQNKGKADSETVLNQALACQEREDFQKQLAGKCLCVLLSDGTREMPFTDIFGQFFPALQKCSLVRFLICTGTHIC